MSLYVDIEKQLGSFRLRVQFETEKEVFAILGASGCGKSLTLKCIAGIEKPDRGIIRLHDRVLFDSGKKIHMPVRDRRVGYLFQDYALFPNMTVLQNIMCGTGSRKRARELAEIFCLQGKEQLYPAQLSGGQKQRTALARMLGAEPEVIMLDEPFSALDNYLRTQLERELMMVLQEYSKPVLFVSHDRGEVYRLTDRIAVMEEGQIVDVASKRELFKQPRTLAATLLTGCKNITRLEPIPDSGQEKQTCFQAVDWGIRLRGTVPDGSYCYAGFRAHYFQVVQEPEPYNVIECRVLRVIEDTFSVIVLFQNGSGGHSQTRESVLTYELPKEDWERIRGEKLYLRIPEDKIIWMER